MSELADRRGVLYPDRLPTFHRQEAPVDLRDRIRWFWIPRWSLPPGRTSRQELLPFPASNLVVEPSGVTLSGPTTGISHRDLSGSGWAVGALLRPAGLASLSTAPQELRDAETPVEAAELHRAVGAAMGDDVVDQPRPSDQRGVDQCDHQREPLARDKAVRAFSAWAAATLAAPGADGMLANAMEDLIASDRSIVRVDQVAAALGISTRAVQRLARRYVGLPPLKMIRRYRLQEAAQRLRDDPTVMIARVAADLGYSDHAHLSADFRTVLGLSPRSYRRGPGAAAKGSSDG
ncbi:MULTISPECIES: helix-turn-helix domain-containing protein [unclassified Dietzia]|uniref:helix-turn-helix domain-containing protein n=1 Tax=unclassified Dietzia TaxID=2617939 RepID=UPI000D229E4A|nr:MULTISPECIES: helix-turn-helix domain-containing protein [unclassified Dietzia]AVZ38916.1 DNA-binding protein [Dietzia sp. JS16-p6b]QGW24055.1 DNA-binding helix-turn-helix protein [Dietzia sp. DQ12-45-1b]